MIMRSYSCQEVIMDQAKAIINLNEGVIQLEGPVEFVQRYLERYAPAIKGISAPAPPAGRAAKQAKTTAGRRRGGRASCARAIRAEVKAGFFDEPKSTKAVRERLTEKGISCSIGVLRTSLRGIVEGGRLQTSGRRRGVVYVTKTETAGAASVADSQPGA